ncbi:zinc-binding dehydrogenase [Streptosporangium carneum]|uniref:NADPH:quinone reductase n=1 Tax=Streptosporangium carneum TaxID=47481 RepID=A0A9W6MGS6_9ACTN|nr:zinc-binding dehydrogenase [Streptosporangium carneum]GLK13228.1 NADPH:quinone reductase [Streptosporangium carneum]
MRVVRVTRFGGPEVLVAGQAPEPVAGPGQVVIGVAVADVLFLETQLRGGWGAEYFDVSPPYVPGGGVGGRVISVGEGVDPGWTGRDVVAMTGGGGYAERAVASVDGLVPVPDGLPLGEAVALLQIGPAALSLVEAAEIKPGERVLVTAAAGGLGGLLVQLAHAAGARVVAAARGARKLDLARELGADVVVDYSRPDWAERVREAVGGGAGAGGGLRGGAEAGAEAGGGLRGGVETEAGDERGADVVFDGVGGRIGRTSFEITARGGRFFAYGVPSGTFTEIDPREPQGRGVGVRGIEQVQFLPEEARRLTERALAEAVAGRIRPVIGQTFPLERAAEAHAAIESRDVVGKTLLLV